MAATLDGYVASVCVCVRACVCSTVGIMTRYMLDSSRFYHGKNKRFSLHIPHPTSYGPTNLLYSSAEALLRR